MRILRTSWEYMDPIDGMAILKKIERCGRVCYKSEDKITDESAVKFVNMITHNLKHESVLEHHSITVKVVCDRGISHEIVRHRIGAYSQESTRYCNYCKDKFNNEITVIWPHHLDYKAPQANDAWQKSMEDAEKNYFTLLNGWDWKPQEARGVLPTELKTEVVMTYNLRQWRHFFRMRCGRPAHPQLRAVTVPMLEKFQKDIPVIFDDFEVGYDEKKNEYYAEVK